MINSKGTGLANAEAELALTLGSSGSKSGLFTLNDALFSSQKPQNAVSCIKEES